MKLIEKCNYCKLASTFLVLGLTLVFNVPLVFAEQSINVGGVSVEVPAPPGFVRTVPEMPRTNRLIASGVPDTNYMIASYITEYDVGPALAGELPFLDRYIIIQSSKRLGAVEVPQSGFERIKRSAEASLSSLPLEMQKQIDVLASQISKGLSASLDENVDFTYGRTIPLPAHHEDERTFAMSLVMKTNLQAADGTMHESVATATSTLVYVKKRVLFVYVYGGPHDLEWTRETSSALARSVLIKN